MLSFEKDEQLKTQRFILGLEAKIRIIINLHEPDTVQKAVNLAKKELN